MPALVLNYVAYKPQHIKSTKSISIIFKIKQSSAKTLTKFFRNLLNSRKVFFILHQFNQKHQQGRNIP